MLTEIDLAYAAGIIDGEGSISICKLHSRHVKSKRGYDFELVVSFKIKEQAVCDWFKIKFGGDVFFCSSHRSNHSDMWVWRITRNKALPFLKMLKLYLKVKFFQAENGIEFQSNIKTRRRKPLTEGEVAVREAQYILQRNLNFRGVR